MFIFLKIKEKNTGTNFYHLRHTSLFFYKVVFYVYLCKMCVLLSY